MHVPGKHISQHQVTFAARQGSSQGQACETEETLMQAAANLQACIK
jgi:hypothetical protein